MTVATPTRTERTNRIAASVGPQQWTEPEEQTHQTELRSVNKASYQHCHPLISALLYLNMWDRVDWCPDVESGCWWCCWSHSCRCFSPDIPPPEVERDWCWDQTHWCWTIHCFLCTRRDSQRSHLPLNTTLNKYTAMENTEKSWRWGQEQADELKH